MSTGDGDSDRLPRLTNPVFAAAGAAEALAGMPTSRAEKASNTAGRQAMTRNFMLDPSHNAENFFPPPHSRRRGTPKARVTRRVVLDLVGARSPGRMRRCAHSRGQLAL